MRQGDDVTVFFLINFIGFGYFYKQITNENKKKIIGSILGFTTVAIVSGWHILHPLILVFANFYIVTSISKKFCHSVSLIYSFLQLLFFQTVFYFGIPSPPAVTRLMHMFLTLKLIGLAFEKNSSKDNKETFQNLQFLDIFYYSFNYVGLLTGPYYSYKTFNDYFKLPFSTHSNGLKVTFEKLKYILIFVILYFTITQIWSPEYFFTKEFEGRSFFYRVMYNWPIAVSIRLRFYIGFLLSECICTMAGFGAYPAYTKPRPGRGPTTNLDKVENLTTIDYSFDTIQSLKIYNFETEPSFRLYLKSWNMTIQYWLGEYIYKRFPLKKYNTVATFFVSTLWHGISPGYFCCLFSALNLIGLDHVYNRLYSKSKSKIVPWIQWVIKNHLVSDMAIPFLYLDIQSIFHYYKLLYCANIFLALALHLLGYHILRSKQNE